MGYKSRVDVMLDGVTADTTSESFGGGKPDMFGNTKFGLKASGGFGGGALTFECEYDKDGLWAPMVNPSTGQVYSFTSIFCMELITKAGIGIRAVLTGAVSSTLTVKRIK